MNAGARRYAATQTQTASRERTLVLLMEAALRHVRAGAAALEGGRRAQATGPLFKANQIVLELLATLDRAKAPALCDQLAAIYEFVALRLTRAQGNGDPALVREAERAFAPLAEAFAEAVASLPSAGAEAAP
jgi:flagellar protein FliS